MNNFIFKLLNQGTRRTVKAKKNIIGMFLIKGVSILVSLIIVPLTISYVSSYQYGIWLTISSLVAWLSFFDIGLGNGLKNRFIESISVGNKILARQYVSTTYALLIFLIGGSWIIAGVAGYFMNWTSILNATPDMQRELLITVMIVLTNFCFQFLLRIAFTLINAVQKPALASLFDTLCQVALLVILVILTKFTQGSLVYLALALFISNIVVLLIGNIWIFSRDLKEYIPSVKFVNFSVSKDVLSLGIKFFFLQVLAIMIYQTNNLIITQMLGPTEVTVYNLAYKYMYILPMTFYIILSPFWSAFAEARTLDDYLWMKHTTKRLYQIYFLFVIGGILMIVVSPLFYKLWIKDVVQIPLMVTVLIYILQMLDIWGTLHTQLLAGLGKIKLQVICSSCIGILYIPVSIFMCKWLGLVGLLSGGILLGICFTSWFGVIQVHRLLNQTAKGLWNG